LDRRLNGPRRRRRRTPLLDDDFLFFVNAWWGSLTFTVPAGASARGWDIVCDTFDPARTALPAHTRRRPALDRRATRGRAVTKPGPQVIDRYVETATERRQLRSFVLVAGGAELLGRGAPTPHGDFAAEPGRRYPRAGAKS